ncbi:MAG: hypothetical protein J6N20_17885, partial [Pseudomonas sp.]|nr:hypothetical protein [Pseudomonas sp.]
MGKGIAAGYTRIVHKRTWTMGKNSVPVAQRNPGSQPGMVLWLIQPERHAVTELTARGKLDQSLTCNQQDDTRRTVDRQIPRTAGKNQTSGNPGLDSRHPQKQLIHARAVQIHRIAHAAGYPLDHGRPFRRQGAVAQTQIGFSGPLSGHSLCQPGLERLVHRQVT